MKSPSLVLPVLTLVGCTAVHYESPQLAERARGHEIIAVLPFEMVFLGKVPKDMTAAQIEAIEEGESIAFQNELYHRLLNQASRDRKQPITIAIQRVETTQQILERHGIGIRQSWAMRPEELAGILGVDAVIRTSVEKTRYLSELSSYAIDLGAQVLDEVTRDELAAWRPPALTRTYDIWVESELVSSADGALLWKYAVQRSTDWHSPANEVVAWVTGKLAKNFPYRA